MTHPARIRTSANEGVSTNVICAVQRHRRRGGTRPAPAIIRLRQPIEYVLYAALGVTAGVLGVAFSKVLYVVEDLCDWAWRGPEWARPATGGVILGGLLVAHPQMYGVGYPVLESAITGPTSSECCCCSWSARCWPPV